MPTLDIDGNAFTLGDFDSRRNYAKQRTAGSGGLALISGKTWELDFVTQSQSSGEHWVPWRWSVGTGGSLASVTMKPRSGATLTGYPIAPVPIEHRIKL
jgi:hypothetical protein